MRGSVWIVAWLILGAPAAVRAECVETWDPEVDYFPHKAGLRHAESFAIEYFGHYKVVTVHTPWPGAEEGRALPARPSAAPPRPDGYDGVQRITIPIRRLAALSTTQLPHLELLDALEEPGGGQRHRDGAFARRQRALRGRPHRRDRPRRRGKSRAGPGVGDRLGHDRGLGPEPLQRPPGPAAGRGGRGHQRRVHRAVASGPQRMAQVHRRLLQRRGSGGGALRRDRGGITSGTRPW